MVGGGEKIVLLRNAMADGRWVESLRPHERLKTMLAVSKSDGQRFQS